MCCNIVFTSGTTRDKSKGVMLSHDNMTWFWSAYNENKYDLPEQLAKKSASGAPVDGIGPQPEELPPSRMVSFLPLSHITAQMSDFTRMLVSRRPIQITFAGPDYTTQNLHKVL